MLVPPPAREPITVIRLARPGGRSEFQRATTYTDRRIVKIFSANNRWEKTTVNDRVFAIVSASYEYYKALYRSIMHSANFATAQRRHDATVLFSKWHCAFSTRVSADDTHRRRRRKFKAQARVIRTRVRAPDFNDNDRPTNKNFIPYPLF